MHIPAMSVGRSQFFTGWMPFLPPTNSVKALKAHNGYNTTTITTILWPLVWDYQGEPVPEKRFTPHTYPNHQPSFISFHHLL